MTAYKLEKMENVTVKGMNYNEHGEKVQIKSISTYWLIAVIAIVFAAGFLANLV